MKAKSLAACALAAFILIAASAHANSGSLDLTFGNGGKVTTDFGSNSDEGKSVVMQADGKIVVAGVTGGGTGSDFALARYNSDGSLDSGFGTGGKVITDFASDGDSGNSALMQSDGKIVVAGSATSGSNSDFALARYNTDGSLDSSFGTGGKVTTDFAGGYDSGNSAVMQSDGKIVVAGSAISGSNADLALARYDNDGSLDTSFGTGGKVTTDLGVSHSGFGFMTATSVAMQADGKFVVAGYANYDIDHLLSMKMVLARYTAEGGLDTTFNGTGTMIRDDGNAAKSVLVQSDGKILTSAGDAPFYSGFKLMRLNPDGSLDTSFNGTGTVTSNFSARCSSMALQEDGKILVACEASGAGGVYDVYDFGLVRYDANGSLDPTFNGTGIVTANFYQNDFGNSVVLQADGKIVIAGKCAGNLFNYNFALARFSVAQCDMRLGPNAAVALGNNIYNLTGAGQTLTSVIRHGGGVKTVIVGVQNDGSATDLFKVHGMPGNAKFAVKYLYGAANVTYAVTHGSFNTGNLAPGGMCYLRAQITAKTPLPRQIRNLYIYSVSATDPTAMDCALIQVKSN